MKSLEILTQPASQPDTGGLQIKSREISADKVVDLKREALPEFLSLTRQVWFAQ